MLANTAFDIFSMSFSRLDFGRAHDYYHLSHTIPYFLFSLNTFIDDFK